MTPEATTHLVISEASEDLIVSEPWTMETYAEGLIDDLFTDIDDILDGNGNRHPQTIRTEYVPVEKVMVTVPEVVLSPASDRTVEVVSPPPNQPTTAKLIVKPPSVTAITPNTEEKKDGLGKMLLVGISASLATVALLYLIQSELVRNLTAKLTPQTPKTSNLPTSLAVDTGKDFVNYMLQALAVIEQQNNNQIPVKTGFSPINSNFNPSINASLNPSVNPGVNPSINPNINFNQTTALALPSSRPVGTLPPPLTANSLPPIPSQPVNVVNPNLPIPVYRAPAPMRYPVPLVPPIPSRISPPNTLVKPPKTEKTVVATAVKVPLPTKQPVVNNQPIRIAPPKLPTPQTPTKTTAVVPQPAPAQPQVAQAPAAPQVPQVLAELEGLLELGDKSAALFKIDGITRRISLGEAIGSTGWTLVEVSKGEAVIRRNGEVRSIYAGQKL